MEYEVHLIWKKLAWWILRRWLSTEELFYILILTHMTNSKFQWSSLKKIILVSRKWQTCCHLNTLGYENFRWRNVFILIFLIQIAAKFSDNNLWLRITLTPAFISGIKELLYISNCCPVGTPQDPESNCPSFLHGQLQLCSGKV